MSYDITTINNYTTENSQYMNYQVKFHLPANKYESVSTNTETIRYVIQNDFKQNKPHKNNILPMTIHDLIEEPKSIIMTPKNLFGETIGKTKTNNELKQTFSPQFDYCDIV